MTALHRSRPLGLPLTDGGKAPYFSAAELVKDRARRLSIVYTRDLPLLKIAQDSNRGARAAVNLVRADTTRVGKGPIQWN
jgi:hypothetical protein